MVGTDGDLEAIQIISEPGRYGFCFHEVGCRADPIGSGPDAEGIDSSFAEYRNRRKIS